MVRLAAVALLACTTALAAECERPTASLSAEIRSTSFTTSDRVRLHVLEGGPTTRGNGAASRGPVIAFVPGWSMPAAIWRAQLTGLGAEHAVAALDPRGQGESEIAPGGYTVERRAADLREFVARYPRVVLVAWSLGALEALHYLHRHGDTGVEALVLVDSSVGEDPAPPAGAGFHEALRRDRRGTLEDFMRGMFRSPRPAPELAALTEAALRMPLEASLSLFSAGVPREHWRGIARGFRKPLMYVVSAQFAAQAQALRRHRPATRVEVFEAAGHALFADEPEKFNCLLSEFVAGLRTPKD